MIRNPAFLSTIDFQFRSQKKNIALAKKYGFDNVVDQFFQTNV